MQETKDEFWVRYERETGEKVISFALGKYLEGWVENASPIAGPLWGLFIVTDKVFRFHHFQNDNWLTSLLNSVQSEPSDFTREIIIKIPFEQLLNAEYFVKKNWWKNLFSNSNNLLFVNYKIDDRKGTLKAELARNEKEFADALAASIKRLKVPV